VRVVIRSPRPDEGERLREIAIASKQYWGYAREEVVRWASQGDFSPAGLLAKDFFVADADGRAIAFSSLVPGEPAVLDDLWVEPEWIGKGVGRRLFAAVADRAAELGASRLEWEAEPHAVGFYARLGACHLRDSGPSVWGRILPVMGIDL
jgi:GNAT superfamily N-acetyltransferase